MLAAGRVLQSPIWDSRLDCKGDTVRVVPNAIPLSYSKDISSSLFVITCNHSLRLMFYDFLGGFQGIPAPISIPKSHSLLRTVF